jgi:hypothetical protein
MIPTDLIVVCRAKNATLKPEPRLVRWITSVHKFKKIVSSLKEWLGARMIRLFD